MSGDITAIKYKAFRTLFEEFMDNLEKIQPNDSSLKMLRSLSSMMPTELIVSQFMSVVDPYKDKIYAKDESFFLNELTLDQEYVGSFIMKEVNKISELWVSPILTEYNKECIWSYFINLMKLGYSIL